VSLQHAQLGMRQTIVPGKRVFIPPSPEESEEACSRGKYVTGGAQQHLPRCRRMNGVGNSVGPLATVMNLDERCGSG
jgi:hypothetical protein